MKERLEQLLSAKGYTSQRFAEIMGVQPSGISHILAGRNKPRFDFLERLLRRFPEVSADWLLLGQGAMFRDMELPGSDAVKDVTGYLDERKEVGNDGNLFPDFTLKHGDLAVGQTVDMDGGIMDPIEPYDEEYDRGYANVDIPYERIGDEPVSVGFSGDFVESSASSAIDVTANSQHTEKSVVTASIESDSRVVPDPSKSAGDSIDTGVTEGTSIRDSMSGLSGGNTEQSPCITNVNTTDLKEPTVVKVILLYDNGTFKSFDNQ